MGGETEVEACGVVGMLCVESAAATKLACFEESQGWLREGFGL